MTTDVSSGADVKPLSLTTAEIDKLLSMTLIANLATLGEDDTIHMQRRDVISLITGIGVLAIAFVVVVFSMIVTQSSK